MRVCLIANQIAAWGKIGGFGTATRAIGAGLARRGAEVSAVVPRRAEQGQRPLEILNGITVHGVSSWETLTSGQVFREIDADIYHSQEPTVATWLAQQAMPRAVHAVTCRDPRDFTAHLLELRYGSLSRRLRWPLTWYYEASPWVRQSVRQADAVFCPAPSLQDRVRRLYGDVQPRFLPSPIDLPAAEPKKSEHPLALFVGRWDRRKRIERFFELARAFPEVHFVAVGRAHEAAYDRRLRERYGRLPNIELPGFLNRFDGNLYRWYERAWVLVNTSVREGLPYTFVEGGAYGCSILAGLDPDQFASRFGYYARRDDFEAGLSQLLAGEWRTKGQLAAEHVRGVFSEQNSVSLHLDWYERLLAGRAKAGRREGGTQRREGEAEGERDGAKERRSEFPYIAPSLRPSVPLSLFPSVPPSLRQATNAGLAIALIVLLARAIPWANLHDALGGVSAAAVAAAMLLTFAARLVESWQMSLAMRRAGMDVSLWRVLLANSLATFYGTFLPGDVAAGLVKWADLAAATGNRGGVLTAIVYNRLVLLAPWIVAAGAGLVWCSPWPGPWISPLLLAGGTSCLVAAWALFGTRLFGQSTRWRLLVQSLTAFRSFPLSLHASLSGLSIVSLLLTTAAATILARAAGLDLAWPVVAWTQSVLVLLRLFPFLLQGLGVREATAAGLLAWFDVPPARAVTFALLGYFNLLAPVAIGAGYQLYRLLVAAARPAAHNVRR